MSDTASSVNHVDHIEHGRASMHKQERYHHLSQNPMDIEEKTKFSSRSQRSMTSTPWRTCALCSINMRTQTDFARHLREKHCAREGGSFVCRYGLHGVCPTLPVDGVSDTDYEYHVAKDHMNDEGFANKVKLAAQSDPPTSSAPSVISNQQKWTVLSSVVNLPAVLNDPRKVKRETDFFTKTWGEAFVEKAEIPSSPYVPRISRIHFEKYLRQTAKKLKEQRRPSAVDPHTQDKDESQNSCLATRSREQTNSELQQVPKMFFKGEFALENQETFEAVLPWSQFRGQQSSKLLQEKLSHYLDMVEVQIARQISMRSNAFFSAMASHDKLQEDLVATAKAVCDLRDKINNIDKVLAKGSLQVMRLKISRLNYVKVYNKLKLMATVHQTQPTIQLLLSNSEFVGALDLISTTHEILTQELAGIQSFRHLSSQLIEMEKLIDKMLCEEFTRYTCKDLNRPLDDPTPTEEDKLSSVILGMMRQRKFSFIDVYREETTSAIKAVIKQTVVEAVSEAETVDSDVTPSSLSEQMRLLNFSQWLELFNRVFINLMILLNRIEYTYGIMKRLVNTAAGRPDTEEKGQGVVSRAGPKEQAVNGAEGHQMNGLSPAPSQLDEQYSDDGRLDEVEECIEAADMLPQGDYLIAPNEHAKLMTGLQDMLGLVCDYMHDRCLKLLIARGKDGFLERLSSSEFLTLSRTVKVFVGNCEEMCGRRSISLIGGLQNQAVKFVSRFHEERKTKLSLILDSERWKQAEVPFELQELLTAFSAGQISLDLLAKTDMGNGGERKAVDCVDVKGSKYAVVGTVLLLLKMIAEYCQCARDVPTATADLLTRVVELLQMFNSRSCQLILGAGALKLVGLKTITTKNLALTSRCLQLVALYIPIVKEFFADRLSLKQQTLLKSFDKIYKDYNDHVQEISSKLVAIMDDSFRSCLSMWEVKAPVPSSCFREICKRIRKLYEAIADLLPPEQIKVLFTRLNASFKTRLKEQLIHLNVENNGGPKHGLVTSDLVFYSEFIKSLDGLGDIVDDMEDIWSWR
ncbi:vacuolar protein sorting-associated protein 54-like [Diadema antillarum]|uniref:vacuolar protein sorting-associated protein 54-like n=1 Tax=Diadema antillarum TaxID=105358 RepID=UPI003A8A0E29